MTPREFISQELTLISSIFHIMHTVKPMVILVMGDRRICTTDEFADDSDKDRMRKKIDELVKKFDPDVVVYTAEAWAVYISKPEHSLPTIVPRPARHPDRYEVVVARIEFRTGEMFNCEARIIRGEETSRLTPFEVMSDDRTDGRFEGFFHVK